MPFKQSKSYCIYLLTNAVVQIAVILSRSFDQHINCMEYNNNTAGQSFLLIIPKLIQEPAAPIDFKIGYTDTEIKEIKHIDDQNEKMRLANSQMLDKIISDGQAMNSRLDIAEQQSNNHSQVIGMVYDEVHKAGQSMKNIVKDLPKTAGTIISQFLQPIAWTVTPIIIIVGITSILSIVMLQKYKKNSRIHTKIVAPNCEESLA